jgi:hypothetical protein
LQKHRLTTGKIKELARHASPDVLDIFLHHMELPVQDVVTLDELNSDLIAHGYMFDVCVSQA